MTAWPSPNALTAQDLIAPPEHDPRDPDQPPIHVAFANTAELSRGAQMALVGGIGSGKTTELQLTLKVLKRHVDAITIYLDLAEITDLNQLNTGAILVAIGTRLHNKLKKSDRERKPKLRPPIRNCRS
jgi:ABC-type protease/lipase transport system fused ATPase/permease subunit